MTQNERGVAHRRPSMASKSAGTSQALPIGPPAVHATIDSIAATHQFDAPLLESVYGDRSSPQACARMRVNTCQNWASCVVVQLMRISVPGWREA